MVDVIVVGLPDGIVMVGMALPTFNTVGEDDGDVGGKEDGD